MASRLRCTSQRMPQTLVIEQEIWEQCKPIAFFSKKLSPAQSRYSTFSKDFLVKYLVIKHFRHLLEGWSFKIFTDHKPSNRYTTHKIRHLDNVLQFTSDIGYIRGADNTVTDTLSQANINELREGPLSQNQIAASQESDTTLPNVFANSSLGLKEFSLPFNNKTFLCDVTLYHPRPYIPPVLRRQVFEYLHRLSHPSKCTTLKLIADHFVWPRMNTNIRDWVSIGLECQRCKVYHPTKSPPGTFNNPDVHFSHIHIDIVGPLLMCHEFQYLLTAINHFSQWSIVIPIKDTSTNTKPRRYRILI